jgi:hypothetical protein
MKKSIFIMLSLASLSLWAKAEIIDIAKNADGTLNKMNHSAAIVYCGRHRDSRLMTSREFAEYGVAHGASGIRETAYPNGIVGDKNVMQEWRTNVAQHFYPVTKQLPPDWNTRIDFYYNSTGYKGDLEISQYWTAEVAPGGSDVANVFQSGDGSISYVGRDTPAAVVCVH